MAAVLESPQMPISESMVILQDQDVVKEYILGTLLFGSA